MVRSLVKEDREKEGIEEKSLIERDVGRNVMQEVLGDLEAKLEAYLVDWRRPLGIQ